MLIYQGEQATFSGHLKDDSGNIVTNLSGYKISAALCRNNSDTAVAIWSTDNSVSGALAITIGSGGLVSFTLPATVTRNLLGTYVFEVKLTNTSTSEVVIGVSKDDLKVARSVVGSNASL